jgi:hypothetical protein
MKQIGEEGKNSEEGQAADDPSLSPRTDNFFEPWQKAREENGQKKSMVSQGRDRAKSGGIDGVMRDVSEFLLVDRIPENFRDRLPMSTKMGHVQQVQENLGSRSEKEDDNESKK